MKGNKNNNVLGFTLKVSGIFSLLIALLNDFFIPIAPYGFYLGIIALIIFIIAVAIYIISPNSRSFKEEFSNSNNKIWFLPFAAIFLFVSAGSFLSHYLTKQYGEQGRGILASEITEIAEIQNQLGVFQEISDNQKITNRILQKSKDIQTDIQKNTANTNRLQEMTNRAVVWNQEVLQEVLIEGDLEMLNKFKEKGKDLRQVNKEMSWAPLANPLIIETVDKNDKNIDAVLDYLYDNQAIQFDKLHDVNNVSPQAQFVWQSYFKKLHHFDKNKNGNLTFKELQLKMKNEQNIIIPDNFVSEYSKDYGSWTSGPNRVRITLYIQAIWSENKLAIDYLSKKTGKEIIGSIRLDNGIILLIDPKEQMQIHNNYY